MCEVEEETFFVNLESRDSNVMLGGISTSTVVISDDDIINPEGKDVSSDSI